MNIVQSVASCSAAAMPLFVLAALFAEPYPARASVVTKVVTKGTQDQVEIEFELTTTARDGNTVFDLTLPPDREATQQVYAAQLIVGDKERMLVAAPLQLNPLKYAPRGTRIIRNVSIADHLLDRATLRLKRGLSGPQSDHEYYYEIRLSGYAESNSQRPGSGKATKPGQADHPSPKQQRDDPGDENSESRVQGLRMKLSLRGGTRFQPDEPIEVDVVIENVSQAPVFLGDSDVDVPSFEFAVEYIGGGMGQGGRVPLTKYGRYRLQRHAGAKSIPLWLDPGKRASYRFPISRMYDMTLSGTYALTASRFVPARTRDAEATKPEKLVSNRVVAEVAHVTTPTSPPEKSDAAETPARAGKPPVADSDPQPAGAELTQRWERWKKTRGRGNTYRYVIQHSCECAEADFGPVIVEVKADKAVSARFARSGTELPEHRRRRFLRTMDDIFQQLQDATETADKFAIAYHPQWGYPLHASVDPQEEAEDDEYKMELLLLSPWIIVPGAASERPARDLKKPESEGCR